MENKAPKKIYVNEMEFENDLSLKLASTESTITPKYGDKIAFNRECVYILESEHNRIVEQLTKEKESLLKALLKAQKRREDTTIGKL